MAAKLEEHYKILYRGANGQCAHEFIIDWRDMKEQSGIMEEDIAKRLADFGFHAPTMSWPVPGTLMIEPTESENKEELDRFCDAMIQIREEVQEVLDNKIDAADSALKNAPHTPDMLLSDTWDRKYSREAAAYPLPWVQSFKVWPSAGRIDNTYGDRNLVCSCPPLEAYEED